MSRVLLVDDEPAVADVVEFALSRAGFEVEHVRDLAGGRSSYERRAPDLVVLDLGLPDGDGLDWCRELRASSRTPILILTCRDDEVDRILGLETGADDYVVKPFSPRELVARVRTILRRATATPVEPTRRQLGRVRIDADEHRVWLDAEVVAVTPTEFALLETLLRSPTRVFSRADLASAARGDGTVITERTIDSHVKGIRRRFAAVDADADPVETVFGVGYRARALR